MSHFVDRLMFFTRTPEHFSGEHGVVTDEDRTWEDGYRSRWQQDRVVRSTHGVNCTGSCSWRIFVKNGLITWELQAVDYPRTRPELPNHEPRGCPRGASYSWYVYSAQRLKYPLVRGRLMELWREARETLDPVQAWESIVEDPQKARRYKGVRGQGGFVRADWDEVTELIAAANVYTIKRYGPDRVIGFSPIPAMSMVSYAAGARYLSLIGGACLSFYDWYCDLPPASPQVWGEQTDVPESADWYNSSYLLVWGSNIPQTRTPDAHFYTEVRYRGTKTVAISPDYGEMVKFADLWLAPRQGTDAALAMAMGHVILREFHLAGRSRYFDDYCRRYTDLPMLVTLEHQGEHLVAGRFLRASDLEAGLQHENNPEWKCVVLDEESDYLVVPPGSVGFRWGETGRWNLDLHDPVSGAPIRPRLSLLEVREGEETVAFPYYGADGHPALLERRVPVKRIAVGGETVSVTTVFDLLTANYGVDRGLGGEQVAEDFDADVPYTPAWAEHHTGVRRDDIITVAREFAENADQTEGRSMVVVGAGINHWYHNDMIYRGIMNLLMLCGCIGKSGGGWAHYVGQEKLRPLTGWTPLTFALDWYRPPRQMNGTSFFYAHTSQWRHEKLKVKDFLAPTADASLGEARLIDFNVRAERMGWLPSAPQLEANPLDLVDEAEAAGADPVEYTVNKLKDGEARFACEDPDNPKNFPRNLFVWRSNLLGSSGKGVEYFQKYLLGTQNAVMGPDLGELGEEKPQEVAWHERGAEGKLDLLVTLDFRMSTTCLYADVVLPSATWYEKDDLNTSDMHPFIHPLSTAVQPLWESRSDWDAYKAIARRFSELAAEHLGTRKDLVLSPLAHDTPGELGQALGVKEWKRGECDPVPGKTMPGMKVVTRDYGATYARFTSLGPLMREVGNGGKGITWSTGEEVDLLLALNRCAEVEEGEPARPRIDSAIDACETILTLAPETNGHVAVKAWEALSKVTGRDHTHLARPRQEDKIRFRDIQAQPRKIITSPIWSGVESERVSYTGGYTNVHELIPWRTLTGRQQFYQDHPWMRDFGEGFCLYKPPVETGSVAGVREGLENGNPQLVLNWITPHQKWGIHSTYTDNQIMLTLSRGGPHVWINETQAREAGIRDNDWIEVYNVNGALTARAVVSQRVPQGMAIMYHAQEKIVNVPAAETSGFRGGIHNSVTRAVTKPTHMIGGYAQLAYGFNYYGTVGSNRDEYVIVRKMQRVDWKEAPLEAEGGPRS
jgi:nitrate reductase alpha subunit